MVLISYGSAFAHQQTANDLQKVQYLLFYCLHTNKCDLVALGKPGFGHKSTLI